MSNWKFTIVNEYRQPITLFENTEIKDKTSSDPIFELRFPVTNYLRTQCILKSVNTKVGEFIRFCLVWKLRKIPYFSWNDLYFWHKKNSFLILWKWFVTVGWTLFMYVKLLYWVDRWTELWQVKCLSLIIYLIRHCLWEFKYLSLIIYLIRHCV